MRAIEKGESPRQYHQYRDARDELVQHIGPYCSYCEMRVNNMLEIDHVVPVSHGGEETSWENFLLSCRYCNAIKGNQNASREGFLWPDIDHTQLAFEYNEIYIIRPHNQLPDQVRQYAHHTINLMGLNRRPGSENEPTPGDRRWQQRLEVWNIAKESLKDWEASSTDAMAQQIARTAAGHGFYSVWLTVFREVQTVLEHINQIFPGTYVPQIPKAGSPLSLRTEHSTY
ncbi:MAG: HNH endonuclease [Bacteroidetes bacterium]|nr:MAG: HNH endonuclease [Bacteroidota bacterium]